MSFANSNMWLIGFQHIITRNLSFGYNFDLSSIPVRQARIERQRNAFMLRHDVSKELATRISYTNTNRICALNKKFSGMDHEVGFKVTQRPEKKTDERMSLASIFRPTKRETSIGVS